MASIWRPFAEEEEPEVIDVIAEGPTEEARSRMKIKVGECERELILNVYLHCGNKGWNAVLRKVREDIKQEPLNARLVDYYLEATDTTVIKRMQRIVREEIKGQAVSTNSTSNAASQVIQNQMRYARKRTPEERRQQKMAEFVSSDEEEDGLGDVGNVLPPKKKAKTVREASLEAQTAHTEMCKKANSGIALMERVLQKLETKIDEM